MTDREALAIVIDFEGDEDSEGRKAFLGTHLADGRDTEEQVDELISDGRYFTVGACSGAGGVVRGCLVPACACWAGSEVAASLELGSAVC